MEIEGVLQLKGYISDFYIWDDTINSYVKKFLEKHNVYPNILLASNETYRKIELYAQKHPERLIAPDHENILNSNEPYQGIGEFIASDYSLEFCINYDLTLGNFILIFDEAPDFDGEPVPLPKEEEKGKIYQFKKTA